MCESSGRNRALLSFSHVLGLVVFSSSVEQIFLNPGGQLYVLCTCMWVWTLCVCGTCV